MTMMMMKNVATALLQCRLKTPYDCTTVSIKKGLPAAGISSKLLSEKNITAEEQQRSIGHKSGQSTMPTLLQGLFFCMMAITNWLLKVSTFWCVLKIFGATHCLGKDVVASKLGSITNNNMSLPSSCLLLLLLLLHVNQVEISAQVCS